MLFVEVVEESHDLLGWCGVPDKYKCKLVEVNSPIFEAQNDINALELVPNHKFVLTFEISLHFVMFPELYN